MDRDRSSVNWQELAAKLFVVAVVLGGIYLLFSRVFGLLLPFLLALLLSVIIRPGAMLLERRLGIPRRAGAIALLILLILALLAVLFFGCQRLILEVQKLTEHISENGPLWGQRISEAMDVLTRLTSHIPFLQGLKREQPLSQLWVWLDARIAELLSDSVMRLSSRIPAALASFVRALPSGLLFFVTFLLSAFYCCADGTKITQALLGYLPKTWRQRLGQGKQTLMNMTARYLRAYFVLFLLTFAELLIGFSVLRLPYTFLPALVIAIVDILPVLGVGTVLIPWGLIELLRGNVALGTGLLILCGIVIALRQVSESRIVGGSLGLHPLATLLAAYVGLELFGLLGVLFGPAVALLIKGLLGQGTKEEGT